MKIQEYVQKSLLLAISSSYDSVWRDLNTRLKQDNCNLTQAIVLISLCFEPDGSVTPSQLANTLRTTPSNISHSLSHLERNGWIRRMLNDTDARSYRLRLTSSGRTLGYRLIKRIDEIETLFERRLGTEVVSETISRFAQIKSTYGSAKQTHATTQPGDAMDATMQPIGCT